MMRFVGLCFAVLLGLVLTINAGFMLVSPHLWFRLPHWLGGTARLPRISTGPAGGPSRFESQER